MKITKKKLTVFVGIGIVVSVLLYILFTQEESQVTTPPPRPDIPRQTEANFDINFEVVESEFDLPRELPLLTFQETSLTDSHIESVANSLGFQTDPIEATDTLEGKTLIYQGEDRSLIARPSALEINYTLNSLPTVTDKQLSDEEIVQIAENFLIDNNFVEPNSIKLNSLNYLVDRAREGVQKTTKENASFYEVNFSPNVTDYPLLTLDPEINYISVRVLPDDTVFSANVISTGKVSSSQNNLTLKNYQEVSETLNEAVLVSLDQGNVHIPDLQEKDILDVAINRIEIAYLLEDTQSTHAQPVYLLTGTANIVGYQNSLNATFYLSALSRNN